MKTDLAHYEHAHCCIFTHCGVDRDSAKELQKRRSRQNENPTNGVVILASGANASHAGEIDRNIRYLPVFSTFFQTKQEGFFDLGARLVGSN